MPQYQTCNQGHTWEADSADSPCPFCVAASLVSELNVPSTDETQVPDELPPPPVFQTIRVDVPALHLAAPLSTSKLPEIPGYDTLTELGRGGMGVVYKARHRKLQRLVALKVILGGERADAHDLARFVAEAEAVAALQHPNIVQIYEVGEYGGLPYLALELVEGGSLGKRIASAPLPAKAAAELTAALARAMQHAHEKGIVHRDLKPANVLLTQSDDASAADSRGFDDSLAVSIGQPKITDFGLAKRLGSDSGQSHSGQVMGTPSYMPPEQATGKTREIGPTADIYALGAILYECLTGRPPFRAATAVETLQQVVHREPVAPSRLQAGVPRDLETICLMCLKKEARKRYSSAAALAADLQRFLDGRPILARRTPTWERAWKWARRRPAAAGLIGVTIAAGVAVALLSVREIRQLDRHNRELEKANKTIAGERDRANQERQRAEDNLVRALEAIDRMLSRMGMAGVAHIPFIDKTRAFMLDDALKLCDQLLATQTDHPATRMMRAEICQRAGYMMILLGRLKEARERLDEALELARKLREEAPESIVAAKINDLLASVHQERGRYYLHSGDEARARTEHEASLAIREEMLAAAPNDLEAKYDVSVCYLKLADVAKSEGRADRVELYLGRARQRAEELVRADADNRVFVNLYAALLLELGLFCVDTDDCVRAGEVLEKGTGQWRKLLEDDANDVYYRRGLGRCLAGLAIASRRLGYFKRAGDYFDQCLTVQARLANEHPDHIVYVTDVCSSYWQIGLLCRETDKLADAIEWFTRAIDALEQAPKALRQGSAARDLLARSYNGRGAIRDLMRQYQAAIADLEKAAEYAPAEFVGGMRLQKALVLSHMGEPRKAAEEIESVLRDCPTTGHLQFDAGRIYVLTSEAAPDRKTTDDYLDRAVALLTKAADGGYFRDMTRRKLLDAHADLKPLHGRPDFEALRTRVREQ